MKHKVKQSLAVLLSFVMMLSLVDISTLNLSLFADSPPTPSYEKADFVIVGGELRGFTESGWEKHSNLVRNNSPCNLIIGEDWGVTAIAEGAFITKGNNQEATLIESNAGPASGLLAKIVVTNNQYLPNVFAGAMPISALTKVGYQYSKEYRIAIQAPLTAIDTTHSNFDFIKLPSTVTTIGDAAFLTHSSRHNESTKVKVELDGTNLVIGNFAFLSVRDPIEIKFVRPNEVKEIGAYAFYSPAKIVNIKNADFSTNSKLSRIGDSAFQNAELYDAKLPESGSLSHIGMGAFACIRKGSDTNSKLTLPSSITHLYSYAFAGSEYQIHGINNLTSPSITEIREKVFYGTTVGDIHLPDNITRIEEYAFAYTIFSGLTLPQTLTTIAPHAFENSTLSTQRIPLVIPNSVTELGDAAFFGCRAFSAVTIGRGLTTIPLGAFGGRSNHTDIEHGATIVGTLTLHEDCTTIKNSAFARNKITNNPFLENGKLSHIENDAFAAALHVPVLSIPTSVTTISNDAFKQSNIGKLEFANLEHSKLTSIGPGAFEAALKAQGKIEFPPSLRTIADGQDHGQASRGCFANNNSITEVVFHGKLESLGNYTFKGTGALTSVSFLGEGVTRIGGGAFSQASKLSSVDLGRSKAVIIDSDAFEFTKALNRFDFSNVKKIGAYAFRESGLTEINIGPKTTEIGNDAFAKIGTIDSISYKPSMNRIPSWLFRDNTINHIEVGENIQTVGGNAFQDATLSDIDFLPANSTIESSAFKGATIATLNITDKYNYLPGTFHSGSSSTVNVSIQELPALLLKSRQISTLNLQNTKILQDGALENTRVSNTFTLPDTITHIGTRALSLVTGLSEFTLTDKIAYIGDFAFYRVHLDRLHIESYPKHMGKHVFSWVLARDEYSELQEGATSQITHKNVSFSDTIEYVPGSMFTSTNIEKLNLSPNITRIEKEAFSMAKLPQTVVDTFKQMPNLEHISDKAFYSTVFKNNDPQPLVIPATIQYLGEFALSSTARYWNHGSSSMVGGSVYNSLTFDGEVEHIGSSAFAGQQFTDFSKLPKWIKDNPQKYRKIMGDATRGDRFAQLILMSAIRGKVFPLTIKDRHGNFINDDALLQFIPQGDGYYSLKPSANGTERIQTEELGDVVIRIAANPYNPRWKSPLTIINGLNNNPLAWLYDKGTLPQGANLSIISGLDLTTPGSQRPIVRIDFADGSYSTFEVPITVAMSMADAWTPTVNSLTINKGQTIDITTAITNKPSNATLIFQEPIYPYQIGLQQPTVRYEFPDKTTKTIKVNVVVKASEADKWIPQTKNATIKHKKEHEEFDLWSLITNLPESGITKSVVTPVYYNMARGTYTGIVKVLFDLDNSFKTVGLRVTILDDATAFIVRVKKLTVLKDRSVNLVDAITEYPHGTGFEVLVPADTSNIGTVTGKLRATFPDLTTADYTIEVEVIDPNTEAAQFTPHTKILKAYVKESVDLTQGLKNLPTNATAKTKTQVNTTEIGRKTGVITVTFVDQSELDIDIQVDVFNKDFFEVDDESEIPSGYSKITFREGTGVAFEDDTIPSRLYAAKNGQPISAKFFPKTIVQDGYFGEVMWTPLIGTVITTEQEFVASAEIDTRTKAEKFVPQTKVLLLYQGDLTTSLTECLVNKPVDMQELNVKVEANRTRVGTNDGLLELVFDDNSKLDIPVRVQIVGKVNSMADRFIANTEELEVEVGGNIDIRTGLKNDSSEYDRAEIKTDVTTTIIGRVTGILEVFFSDGSSKEVAIRVFVKDKGQVAPQLTDADRFTPQTKQLEVPLGGNIDITTGLLNDASEYERKELVKNVSTTTAGIVTGIVRVHFADNSAKDVEISVLVKSVQLDNSLASQYLLETKTLEAKAGDAVDIKTAIVSDTTNIAVLVLEDVDTTFAGQKAGRLQLKFADGSILETAVKVNVTGKTSIDINGNGGGNGGTNTNNTQNHNSNVDNTTIINGLKEALRELQNSISNMVDNSTHTSNVTVKEQDKLGKPIIKNTFDVKSYLTMPTNKRFHPDARVTRADLVVMFAAAKDLKGIKPVKFSDTKNGEPYFKALQACVSNNIINGYEDGTFRPNNPLTRAEFAKIIGSLDTPSVGESRFTDAVTTHWAKRFIDNAFINGYLDGYPDGTFKPDAYITRAEAIKVLNRYVNKLVLSSDLLQADGIIRFTDVPAKHWAFDEITSAVNTLKIEEFVWSKDKTKKLFYRLKESK